MLMKMIVTLFAFLEVAVATDIHDDNLRTNKEYLYDDLVLTHEQHLTMRERGFFVPGKWPMRNGTVTVHFYFNDSIPVGDTRRATFRKAAELYKQQTCIEWVETNASSIHPKVQVYSGKGCSSSIGMLKGGNNQMSLHKGCNKVGVMMHEMGHTMGLFHTQTRPDRDQYVQVWQDNILPGHESNFLLNTGSKLFGTPYDYLSIMHYGNYFFSKNESFTLTPREPFAMFAIGGHQNNFRWSDAALLNKGYLCDVIFERKCKQPQKCENGGFIGKNCKCVCPENTKGEKCQTMTGPLFNNKPKCGGIIDKEGDIQSEGFGVSSTTDPCIFHIKAPNCSKPQITVLNATFHWKLCDENKLAIQVSRDYFGYVYCNDTKVPIGATFTADGSEAAVYYVTKKKNSKTAGFRANIAFLHDPSSCMQPSVVMTTSPPTTTITTTTSAAPKGICVKKQLGSTLIYQTPSFPSYVKSNTHCSASYVTSEYFKFSKLNISMVLGTGDVLYIQDQFDIAQYRGQKGYLMTYRLWPLAIGFNAGISPLKGFKASLFPPTDLPSPCNGEVITLDLGESRIIRNPLIGTKISRARCAFLVQTGEYNKIEFTTTSLGADKVHVNPYFPQRVAFKVLTDGIDTSSYHMVAIYFGFNKSMQNWEITFLSI